MFAVKQVSHNYGWTNSSVLSEFGTLHLEFAYLSDITGIPLYRELVEKVRQVLKDIEKPKGLYPILLDPTTGNWGNRKWLFIKNLTDIRFRRPKLIVFDVEHISLGALGDSFYEYLLKSWIQSNKTDNATREMYDEAMVANMEHMIHASNTSLIYTSDLIFDEPTQYRMQHLACFIGILDMCDGFAFVID